MKNLLLLSLMVVGYSFKGLAIGGGCTGTTIPCANANPFCTSTAYNFANATGTCAPSGPNYGCLSQATNPVWYYMQIGTAGSFQINISQTTNAGGGGTGLDVDFALWGPFNSLTAGCSSVNGGVVPIQSSYSTSATETIGIGMPGGSNSICATGTGGATTPAAAIVGKVYIVLITNYSGNTGFITFNQTGGTGVTNCAIVPLPIQISSFTGTNLNRTNYLTWQTASESNNDYFSIERSTDGMSWESIGKVYGGGNSESILNYDFSDYTFSNTTNYYKLIQTDFNGMTSSSNIIFIDNSLQSKTIDKIYNLVGQQVDLQHEGLKIILYTDGTMIKQF